MGHVAGVERVDSESPDPLTESWARGLLGHQEVAERELQMTHQSAGRSSCLSMQERKVQKLITNGLGSKEIAASMRLSPLTVKRHVENILRKLHVKNRVEAAVYAVKAAACEMLDESF